MKKILLLIVLLISIGNIVYAQDDIDCCKKYVILQDELKDTVNILQQSISKLEEERDKLKKDLGSKKLEKIKTYKEKNDSLINRTKKLEKQIRHLKDDTTKINEENKKNFADLESKTHELQKTRDSLKNQTEELISLRSNVNQLTKDTANLYSQVQKLKNERDSLKSQNEKFGNLEAEKAEIQTKLTNSIQQTVNILVTGSNYDINQINTLDKLCRSSNMQSEIDKLLKYKNLSIAINKAQSVLKAGYNMKDCRDAKNLLNSVETFSPAQKNEKDDYIKLVDNYCNTYNYFVKEMSIVYHARIKSPELVQNRIKLTTRLSIDRRYIYLHELLDQIFRSPINMRNYTSEPCE